jgi:hypothetical protein
MLIINHSQEGMNVSKYTWTRKLILAGPMQGPFQTDMMDLDKKAEVYEEEDSPRC